MFVCVCVREQKKKIIMLRNASSVKLPLYDDKFFPCLIFHPHFSTLSLIGSKKNLHSSICEVHTFLLHFMPFEKPIYV